MPLWSVGSRRWCKEKKKQHTTFILCDVEHRIYLTTLLPVWEGTCTLLSAALLDSTFTGLWGVVKTIKVCRKNLCVVSSFVSRCVFIVSSVQCRRRHGEKGCRCRVTTANAAARARHVEVRGRRCCSRCWFCIADKFSRIEG